MSFGAIYLLATPYRELQLIRNGNIAAAISLGGAIVGFALTVHATIIHSHDLVDLAKWGVVALASQLLAYTLAAFLLRDLRRGIEDNRIGYGIMVAAIAVAVGLVIAGSVSE